MAILVLYFYGYRHVLLMPHIDVPVEPALWRGRDLLWGTCERQALSREGRVGSQERYPDLRRRPLTPI